MSSYSGMCERLYVITVGNPIRRPLPTILFAVSRVSDLYYPHSTDWPIGSCTATVAAAKASRSRSQDSLSSADSHKGNKVGAC